MSVIQSRINFTFTASIINQDGCITKRESTVYIVPVFNVSFAFANTSSDVNVLTGKTEI
jgi:hypothetical protein